MSTYTNKEAQIAKFAKAMGHPARVAIISLLLKKSTCICGDIVEELPLSQSTVSQHLKELKAAGIAYKEGSFPFKALGRAVASMDVDGLAKVLADANTDEILGVHIIGARAADMIAEAVVAMEFRASAEDVARMSHAHPTYTEAMKEACLAATAKRSIHS